MSNLKSPSEKSWLDRIKWRLQFKKVICLTYNEGRCGTCDANKDCSTYQFCTCKYYQQYKLRRKFKLWQQNA